MTLSDLHGNPSPILAARPVGRSVAADPLSIVHVAAPAPFGGLETVLRALSKGQTARGHRVHVVSVVSPSQAEHPFTSSLRDAGVAVTTLVLPTRAYLEERRQIERVCRAVGADVIHTHGYRPDVIDSGVARALRIPRVSTVHGFCDGNWKGRLYERLQIKVLSRFDGVIAVAQPQIERLVRAGLRPERIELVPNAWVGAETLGRQEARAALHLPQHEFRLGWVGRLSREKGADVFIEALGLLRDLPVFASVIGDGSQRSAVEDRARELGIGDRLRWHGALSDAGRYFAAFDAFVLSSRTEGTPMVLLEAMGAHTPIVAAAVGGVPHVVSNAEALLSAPEDPGALAAAIRNVYADRLGARQRSDRARVRLETDFGPSGWLDRHDSLYRRLVHTCAR